MLLSFQSFGDTLIFIGAFLVSAQFRLQLPFGKPFDAEVLSAIAPQRTYLAAPVAGIYDAVPAPALIGLFAVIAISTLLTTIFSRLRQQHIILFGGLLIALTAFFWIGFPALSRLQIGYFCAVVLILKSITALSAMLQRRSRRTLIQCLRALWQSRTLLLLWTQYNVRSRYSQSILGIAWTVLLPVTTAGVLALAFSNILRASVGDVPFVVFMLAAIVPWNLTNNGILTGTRALLGSIGLMNQVYFPREILVLVTLGEGVTDFFVTFLALIVIALLSGFLPTVAYIAFPVLFFIQMALTVGLMFLVSSASVLIRDIPPLVSVGLQLLFFLTPIIYPPDTIPTQYRVWLVLNPFSAVIQGYRDMVLGRMPALGTLVYPAVFGVAILIFGYSFLKANEYRVADLV